MTKLRSVEVCRDGTWVATRLIEVKRGELFRIQEDDGTWIGARALTDGYMAGNVAAIQAEVKRG